MEYLYVYSILNKGNYALTSFSYEYSLLLNYELYIYIYIHEGLYISPQIYYVLLY